VPSDPGHSPLPTGFMAVYRRLIIQPIASSLVPSNDQKITSDSATASTCRCRYPFISNPFRPYVTNFIIMAF